MEQYLLQVRKASHGTLPHGSIQAFNSTRDSNNAAAEDTDVGRASRSRHPAVRRVANEFGLRRKQRLAFHVFGSDWVSRGGETPSSADALRLYIGGGAGTGKSHVLRAIKALIECPTLVGPKRDGSNASAGRLLTVAASRGKRADGIGGIASIFGKGGGDIKTIDSVCDVAPSFGGAGYGGGCGKNVGGVFIPDDSYSGEEKRPQPAEKAAHWEGVTVLAIEEIGLVSCDMILALDRAASSVRPPTGQPFGGLTVIFLGDFDNLKPEASSSVATPYAELNQVERIGFGCFRSVNQAVVLDGGLGRFSGDYATVMKRIRIGECTGEDVDFLNSRNLDGVNLGAALCWDAKFINFRDNVSQAVMLPIMRTWCEARGTPLFLFTASDVLVGDQKAGQAKQVPDPEAPWPPGLRDGIHRQEAPKTAKLPLVTCLAIGAKVVMGRDPQHFKLGVTNNADGEITHIYLDPRESFLQNQPPGYRVVQLQFPPARVLVHIDAADKAGLHMPDLPRGVMACFPLEREFSVVGRAGRTFTIRRTQLPLFAGCLTSVYRAQGNTYEKVGLTLRKPVGGAMDSRAAVHAALSRAAEVDKVYLLGQVSLDDITNRQDAGVVALMKHLRRLEKTTLETFLSDTSTYRPGTADEPAISPTCRDDLANQRDVAGDAARVDGLDGLNNSGTDSISDGDASTPQPTTAGSPDDQAEQRERKADAAAAVHYLQRLEEATLINFLEDPSKFRPARVDPPTTTPSEANRGSTTSDTASGSSSYRPPTS